MTLDIRAIYETLGLTLESFNTVASFSDAGVDGVLVISTTPDMKLFGTNYVIFDSYEYSDIYLVLSPSASSFNIDVAFTNNDPSVPIYNVTTVYQKYLGALEYINSLDCIDQTSDFYLQIVEYYALYLLDIDINKLTDRSIEGKYSVKFSAKSGSENKYYQLADQLSGGCLTSSAMASKKINPLFEVVSSGDCRDGLY